MESNSKINKITDSEYLVLLNNILPNNRLKLATAAGEAVDVEIRMRLIGQFSEQVRNKIQELVAKKKRKKSSDYWDCDLFFLEQAIIDVFRDKLESSKINTIEKFRILRNKLLHADFVGLMEELGIEPTSQEIFKHGKRGIVMNKDIKEALLSVERNQGFKTFEMLARETSSILDKLLINLVNKF